MQSIQTTLRENISTEETTRKFWTLTHQFYPCSEFDLKSNPILNAASCQSAVSQQDPVLNNSEEYAEGEEELESHLSEGVPSQQTQQYSRKEKSLGELCRRFLHSYGIEGKGVLLLDSCTKELGVERRRIYDIINILESFCVIRRRAKNEYQWRGIDKIAFSIEA